MSYSFPLRPPCPRLLFLSFFHGNTSPSAQGYQQVSPNVPHWTGSKRKASLGVPLLMWQQGLYHFFLLQRYQQLSLESTSKVATFDLFLELLVIVFLGDPVWQDSPAAICCLEPAVRLSHNNLSRTHSFPVEKKRII